MHEIDQCREVNGKLGEDRCHRVQIEDVRQWRLLGQDLEGFRAGNEEETCCRQQTVQRKLGVAVLDAIDVQDRLTVGRNERVQG